MDDISDNVQAVSSAPEEAASNIQNATLYGTTPVADKDVNQSMADTRNKMAVPTQAESAVKNYMDQSTEHAAVAIGDPQNSDIAKLNYFSRLMKYFGDQYNGVQPQGQRAASLAFRQMQNGGKLSPEDDMELWQLNQNLDGLSKRNYDLVPERPPRDMFDFDAEEMGKSALKFGADAVLGLANLPRSIYQGTVDALQDAEQAKKEGQAPIGYSPWVSALFGASGMRDYIGAVYNQYSNSVGADGKVYPMDEETKKNLAWGSGAVYGSIMVLSAGVGKVVSGALAPALSPEFVATAMQAPENAALRIAMGKIGGYVAGLGTMGALNETSQIVSEEIQNHYDGTKDSIYAGITAAGDDIAAGKYTERIARAGALGGVMGIGTGLLDVGVNRNAIRAQVGDISARGQMLYDYLKQLQTPRLPGDIESEGPVGPKDVTPKEGGGAPALPPPESPPATEGPTNVFSRLSEEDQKILEEKKGDPNDPEVQKILSKLEEQIKTTPEPGDEVEPEQANKVAQESLQFHQGLHDMNDVLNSTKMAQVAPAERAAFVKTATKEAGIPYFVTTIQDLFDWTSKSKVGKAKDWFGVSKIQTPEAPNTPITVDPVEVFDAAKEDPSILEKMAPPTGIHPTAVAAMAHLDAWQKKQDAKAELFQKLGLKPEDVKPEPPKSNVENLPEKEKAPPYDFEATAKKTRELIDQHSAALAELDKRIAAAKATIERGGFPGTEGPGQDGIVDLKYFKKDSRGTSPADLDKYFVTQAKKRIPKLENEKVKLQEAHDQKMTDLKDEVAQALKKPDGKLIFGHWPEPGMEDTTQVVAHYLNGPSFSDAVRTHVPDAQLEKIDQAELESKKSRIEDVMSAAQYEMDKVQNIHIEEMKEARLIEAFDQLKNNPDLAITEKFRSSLNEKKKSIYQIDPNTLTKEQVELVELNKPRFKGVFAKKGGQDLTAVAQLLGLPDGDTLLKTFATTPTRDEMAKAIAGLNSLADAADIRNNDDLNHVKIIESLRNKTQNLLRQLEVLRGPEWAGFKTAIKTIGRGAPRIEAFEEEARAKVAKTQIKDLNYKVFQSGRIKSERKAIDAVLKGDIGTGWVELERAAWNAAMERETRLQIGLANKRLRFARKFTKKETQVILKEAGKSFVEAAKEILDLWKLSTPFKNTSINGAYRKWMMKELKAGRGDLSIPPELSELRDSPIEMTVEQLMVIGDRLNMIYQMAKREKRLIQLQRKADREKAAFELSRVEDSIVKTAKSRHAYDEKRQRPPYGNRTRLQNFFYWTGSAEAFFAGKQNITREMDEGRLGGFFYHELEEELAAAFYDEKQINKEREAYLEELRIRHNGGKPKTVVDKVKDKVNLRGYAIDRVEQKVMKVKELGGLRLTKADIMVAYANFGTTSNKERILKNNGFDEDTWQKVFDKYLEPRDVEYIHGIFDWYKKRRPQIAALQKRQGREITFIEGIPITHQGKTRMGGYIRLRYENEYALQQAKQAEDYLENKDAAFYEKGEGAKWGRQWAAETTWQGHTIERTGSTKPVSLSFLGLHEGMAEIDHDLVYREPMENFFKKMSRPAIVKALTALVGEPKLKTLIQTNLELAGRPATRDDGWFTDGNRFVKALFNKLTHSYTIQILLGNWHVFFKQFESTFEMLNALGPYGVYYATTTLLRMMRADYIPGMVQFAREMDPAIEKYITDASDTAIDSVMKNLPRKGGGAILDPIKNAGEMIKTGGFYPIVGADLFLKTWQAMTIARMVLDGHMPGLPMEVLDKMSWEEKSQKIQSIIQQASTVLQIQNRPELKAPVQKHMLSKPFTFFWNYPRNILNNIFLDFRRVKWKLEDANEKLGQGGGGFNKKQEPPAGGGGGSGEGGGPPPTGSGAADLGGAGKDVVNAAGIGLWATMWSVFAALFTAWIYGRTLEFGKKRINNMKDLAEWGEENIGKLMLSRVEQTLDVTPAIKDMQHAIQSARKYQIAEVQNPITQALSEFATCFRAVRDSMLLSRHFSRIETRACLMAEGYIPVVGVAWPTHATDQFMSFVESRPKFALHGLQIQPNQVAAMSDMTKEYAANPPANADPKYVQGIQQLHTQLAGDAAKVPKGMADTIKMAESQGDWRAPNGVYGFTESQWDSIKRSAPELDLTENGRIAKNTEQQEKAMSWQLEHNAKDLAEKNLPVTKETMFGAHKVGVENYEKLYNASGDESLKKDFPSLAKDPEFAHFNTVADLMGYFAKKLDAGSKGKLTQNTPNAEDKL